MTGFIYLASPYTHENPSVREQRYLAVCRAAAALMRAGHVVYSPIAHSHPIEVSGMGEQMSGEFWKNQCIPVLSHASRLVVLMLPGWTESAGIKWEIDTAQSLHMPVDFITPDNPKLFVGFDLVTHLHRQKAFSSRTFGPGMRTAGVSDHIRKELQEIAEHPDDLEEWVDVILLALDGAWRCRDASPTEIVQAIAAKQSKNEERKWPDWRSAPTDRAIEHVR